MKRTIATLGVVGLGLLGATVSANAAPSGKITICHATHSASNPYVAVTISLSALSEHTTDTKDIVPANTGEFMPHGQNLTPENIAILNAGCRVAGVPPVIPPVISPTSPPVDPVTSPPVDPVTSPPVDPVTSPPSDPVTSTPVTPSSPGTPVERVEPATPVVSPAVPPAAAPTTPVPAAITPAAPAAAANSAAPAAASGTAAAPEVPMTNAGYNVQTAVGGRADAGIPAWLAGLTALFGAGAAVVVVRSGVRARKASH
jgi:hypothetical protein